MRTWRFQYRVAATAAVAAALALVLFAGGTWLLVRPWVLRVVDEELAEEATELVAAGMLAADVQRSWEQHPWLGWRIVESDGRVRPGGLRLDEAVARRAASERGTFEAETANGHWRVRAFARDGATLVLARDMAAIDGLERAIRRALAWALPLAVIGVGVVAEWGVRRALGPLRELAREAAAMGPQEPGRRLPVPVPRDELRDLAETFNAMLARLERGLAQSRDFAGEVSHELRTPLTIMRGEVAAMLAASGEAGQRVRLASLEEEIARLDRIVEHLLQIARFEAGQGLGAMAELDFSALVVEVLEDVDLLATARGVRLETAVELGRWVRGDGDQLRRLLLNVLDNATHYNRKGGYVRAALVAEEGGVAFTVTNSGEGIPEAEAGRVFERFHRAARQEPRSGGGGLGLSLAREIARAHGGELRLVDAAAEQVTFRLSLPRRR